MENIYIYIEKLYIYIYIYIYIHTYIYIYIYIYIYGSPGHSGLLGGDALPNNCLAPSRLQ